MLKQIGIDNGRNSVWNNGVGVFIFTDVLSVFENETQAGNAESRAFSGAKSALVQRIGNGFNRFTAFIARKDFGNQRCGQRINGQHTICADDVSERNIAAVAAAFERILFLSALNLLGQLCGIVLCIAFQHGFKDNAFRPFGNIFAG